MRRVIVATLALSPFMLHAQANSPAPAQASSSTPVLQSKLIKPNAFAAGDRAPTSAVRVSTGVEAPKLISTVEITSDHEWAWVAPGISRTVVVNLIVDAAGKPLDLKIAKSAGPELDKHVLAAVSQYRFKPGMLNHQPTAVPVNLEITMRRPLP